MTPKVRCSLVPKLWLDCRCLRNSVSQVDRALRARWEAAWQLYRKLSVAPIERRSARSTMQLRSSRLIAERRCARLMREHFPDRPEIAQHLLAVCAARDDTK